MQLGMRLGVHFWLCKNEMFELGMRLGMHF